MSGELMLGDAASGEAEKRMGIYRRIEKKIRALESASGSVVGVTGALYAARGSLLVPIPPETILNDVLLPLHVSRQGARVVFDGRARAWDDPDLGADKEFRRKVRTLTGDYQLLQIAPWVLSGANPLRFRFLQPQAPTARRAVCTGSFAGGICRRSRASAPRRFRAAI